MEPVPGHHRRAVGAARLRDLVLVVGEDEVDAAAVDVEGLAEKRPGHRRAFEVPARPPRPPGRRPGRLARLRGFPEDEVHRVALVGRHLDAGAGDHLVERTVRQAAVVRHRSDVEEHVPLGRIGIAPLDQLADEADHVFRRIVAADVLRRPRLVCRREAAEGGHVLVELLLRPRRHLADRLVQRQVRIFRRRPRVDLVVDVGDVADISHVLRPVEMAEQPEEHVEDDQRPRIADMGEVVDRRPADIHAHVRRIDRDEILLRPRQRVVQLQTHAETNPLPPAGRSSLSWKGQARTASASTCASR